MKYFAMIYCNHHPLDTLAGGGFERRVHARLPKAAALRAQGPLSDSRQLAVAAGLSVRLREGQASALDGACAEAR